MRVILSSASYPGPFTCSVCNAFLNHQESTLHWIRKAWVLSCHFLLLLNCIVKLTVRDILYCSLVKECPPLKEPHPPLHKQTDRRTDTHTHHTHHTHSFDPISHSIIKVYFNGHPPWSEVCIADAVHSWSFSLKCYAYLRLEKPLYWRLLQHDFV